ncbi:hypothetical protein [Alteromonas gilva]|uniref:Uncharacterized protein n=1 Tax=Alteromonas gilva TaxID=2987522 RepID=A0ABT5L4K1_9ALTE|nr:hypothetical protein [Alteromonas gilva]MDC8831354.1 hypothetical protein [Alteromonas gilva]
MKKLLKPINITVTLLSITAIFLGVSNLKLQSEVKSLQQQIHDVQTAKASPIAH